MIREGGEGRRVREERGREGKGEGGEKGKGGDANNIVNRRRLARTHAKDIPFPCARIN